MLKRVCASIIPFMLSLSVCLSLEASGGVTEEKKYVIGESQLQAIESRIKKLKVINQQSLKVWQNQEEKLKASEVRCQNLEKKLEMQEQESRKQEELLKKLNLSFQTFAKEQKSKLHKERMQKGIWIGVSAILAGIAISK